MENILVWLDIPVLKLDRAIKFYSAVLGAKVSKESAHGCEFGLLPHAGNSVSACLCVGGENKPSKHGPLVYLNVSGRLDAAVKAAKTKGGKLVQKKHPIGPYGFKAVILDSEGNQIALHSPTK